MEARFCDKMRAKLQGRSIEMKTLQEALERKENHVNLIKLAAAYLVIIGHAYAFACNYSRIDFMAKISKGAYNLGGFAVAVFFFFSGLFITKSLLSKKYSAVSFWKRRCFRIFPPLIFVSVFIIILCGLFITTKTPAEYFCSRDTYRYLLNCVFLSVHTLPGVFENNISGAAVNGPIWTIKFEAACYVLAYVLYKFKILEKKRFQYIIYLFAAAVAVIYGVGGPLAPSVVLIRPVGMFLAGIMFYVYREHISLRPAAALAAVLVYGALFFAGLPELGIFLALPYVLCVLAFLPDKDSSRTVFAALGKCSYEIYLWGGFVGQAVTWWYGGQMEPWLNMVLTIILATAAGFLTNMILERRKYEIFH